MTFCPVNISDISGKITPQKQTTRIPINSKLFSRNKASRESMDDICVSALRSFQRLRSKDKDTIKVIPMKAKNNGPIALWAKACTEESTPERVRNVPKITNSKVKMIRIIFQCFNMPRFSWIITECKNAVPVNQGINAAISTGSQPQ